MRQHYVLWASVNASEDGENEVGSLGFGIFRRAYIILSDGLDHELAIETTDTQTAKRNIARGLHKLAEEIERDARRI